jgi:glucose/arabinose dehydrogenase
MIAFGPDGFLWIALGDGGKSNNSLGHAQRPDTLHGSMLRIVVGADGVDAYGVPPDNPYANGDGGRQEVWAIGLRNPWRFAFDGNDLWIADVGQGSVEEVNLVAASAPNLNYGWSIMEGSACFQASSCVTDGLVLPIAEYAHSDGCSITGGAVYRGRAIPSLAGQFFYADFCSGLLRSVDAGGNQFDWTDMVGALPNPTGFGIGGDGEMYITSQGGDLLLITTEGS